jgi:hypothetical protein
MALSRTVAIVVLVRRYESMTPTCYGVQPLIPAGWPFSGVSHRAAADVPVIYSRAPQHASRCDERVHRVGMNTLMAFQVLACQVRM